jgi:DNA-nicking Smr family endonuclease
MKRRLRPDELKLWAAVLRTVRPARGRTPPRPPEELAPEPKVEAARPTAPLVQLPATAPAAPRPKPVSRWEADPIEPNRQRRIARERDPIDGRIDLHGLDQFTAEDRLKAFLFYAHDLGLRAVLVITGKGTRGDGVIRRRAPEWLADPALRHVVAGVSAAHRRHGGEGALYVALKRRAERPDPLR